MARLRHTKGVTVVVLAIYALVMATVGLLHNQTPTRAASPAIDLSVYALPDGTLPPLCLGDVDGDGGPMAAPAGCAACLLTSAPGLPPTSPILLADRLYVAERASAFRFAKPLDGRAVHITHQRGPPLLASHA